MNRTTVRRLCLALAVGWAVLSPAGAAEDEPLLGYSEYRTNLPGGRLANMATMRAYVVRADGAGRRPLGKDLARQPWSWTQFAGFAPEGGHALVVRGWESPDNAAWEEKNKRLRLAPGGWQMDVFLVDLAKGKAVNVTAAERVSHYNVGAFFWPADRDQLAFAALRGGDMHLFRMDRAGRGKTDLTPNVTGFAFGFTVSPAGRRLAYYKENQVFLADTDGGNARPIQTNHLFNAMPQWSPDGKWLLFLSGEPNNSHPHLVRPDGTDLRKLADRQGHDGQVRFLDLPDAFAATFTDVPVWAADSTAVWYTARVGENVEVLRVGLNGQIQQLTHSKPGVRNWTPRPSPDGKRLAFCSDRTGTRQLYVMDVDGTGVQAVTAVKPGWGAMWPLWQRPARGK